MTFQMQGTPSLDTELEEFITRCLDGLSHQVAGNSTPFLEVWSHAHDVAILGAVDSFAQG